MKLVTYPPRFWDFDGRKLVVRTVNTGAGDRSDRCRPFMGFASGECLGEFLVVSCFYCFEFG
jgi:hypothetical protein